jgi:KaiC/GvpD/RAD55 family RecA-like ATPase
LLPVKSVSEVLAQSGEGPAWKVRPLLASSNITDLSGEAKLSGKTTFSMHMIASVVKGEDFMGFPTEKSKVLYLTEQGNNFAEALQKAGLEGADGELFVIQHKDVRGVEWKELLSKAVEECNRRGIGVLVVDTFAAFSGIVGAEENNSGDIRDKMAPLKEAAQEHGLAVLYVRHAGKSGRARGSSQFEAEGDIILTLKRPEGNHGENVRVLEGIGRYDEIPRKLNVELTDEGYVALGSAGQIQFGKAVEVIRQRLPRTRESAISQDELLEEIKDEGVSRKTMQRALDWLYNDGRGEIRREPRSLRKYPG